MSVTRTTSGTLSLKTLLGTLVTGDWGGGEALNSAITITLAATGGAAPTVTGWMKGTLSLSGAVTLLLAHATDPLQGAGDATYSPGLTVASSKLKGLIIKVDSSSGGNLTIERPANPLPIFNALGDALTLDPGGMFVFFLEDGTAALTTGSNDALLITPSAGTVTGTIIALYGS